MIWDEFVSHAKNATFLFKRDFMDYHKDRFQDYSLLVYKKNKLIALLPANVNANTLYSHQGLTYGGLVTSKNTKFQEFLEVFKTILKWLHNEGIESLYIKSLPSIYTKVPSDELSALMVLLHANLYRRDMLSVISLSEEVCFAKNRKEGLRRGEKYGLVVEEVEEFETFWNIILIPNLLAKHQAKPVHSLEEITKLKAKFPKNIRQFNVYHEGKLVAGSTVFVSEVVAHSQYISANNSKNELGSLDFLHAHLITKVFKAKRYFDFGTSNENEGRQVNKGLLYWKEGFGARTITQDFYAVATNNFKALDNVWI